jgi:hypothetical protein
MSAGSVDHHQAEQKRGSESRSGNGEMRELCELMAETELILLYVVDKSGI